MRKKQIERDTTLLTIYSEIPDSILSEDIFSHPIEFNNKKDAFPPSIKSSIRVYSQGEIILRLVNLDDQTPVNISLLDLEGYLKPLSHFSGMRVLVKASQLRDVSLNTILDKKQILEQRFKIREGGEINIDSLLIRRLDNIYRWKMNKKNLSHKDAPDQDELASAPCRFDFSSQERFIENSKDRKQPVSGASKTSIFLGALLVIGTIGLCACIKSFFKPKPKQQRSLELVEEDSSSQDDSPVISDRNEDEEQDG